MTMRMLIDARHREETRVAVVKGTRIEEFDFESAERKQLKGNIYLAKVTRVEPSLQAAFIDYGGNRHGFLAFSEIHPDYYQIPREDREALLREEAAFAEAEAARADDEDERDAPAEADDELAPPPPPQELHSGGDQVDEESVERWDDDGGNEPPAAPRPEAVNGGGDDHAAESLRQKRTNLRHRYKIQDVIHRRQVLLVQVVKEERGNKGAALTTYLSLAGRYCVLMPNTSHGGGISRKISNAADRKRLKSIMADLRLPPTMGCIVRTAGLQRSSSEIKRDFDYLARLWDEVREKTLGAAAPALIHADSDLIKRAIRDIYNKDIDEVIVEGEEGYNQARSFMKLLSPTHARKVKLYIDTVPLFQRGGVEDQLAAMYNPVVQLKSGGYLVINPTEALVSIDVNSGRSTREHNIEQTALSTNVEAAHEIARQLRLRDMAGLVVIDFIDMESNSNNRRVEKAIKDALKNDRARIQVGRISSFGLFEMSRQRLRTGVLEASTRTCPHCDGTGLVRTASSAGLQALRMLEEEAARGRASQLRLRASQEAAFYVLNRKRAELAEIEDRYGVMIEIVPDGAQEGARMAVEAGGPPPVRAPRLPQPVAIQPEDEEPFEEEIEDETDEEETSDARVAERPAEPREGGAPSSGRRRRRRRGGSRGTGTSQGEAASRPDMAGADEPVDDERVDDMRVADPADESVSGAQPSASGTPSKRRRSRRGGRGRSGGGQPAQTGMSEAESPDQTADAAPLADMTPDMIEADGIAADEAVAEAAAPDVEAPRPRGRRRPSARPPEPVADAGDAGMATGIGQAEAAPPPVADASSVTTAEPVEPPKPRRGRPRKAATVGLDEASATAASEETPAPAPRSRSRKRVEPADAAAAAVEALPEGPVPAEAETDEAAPSADDAREPETAGSGDSAADGPPRRGWWQRTFGA